MSKKSQAHRDLRAFNQAAREAERAALAAKLPLTNEQLEALLDAIDAAVTTSGCDHSDRHARAWLEEQALPAEGILGALREMGGYCDCEIVLNVEPEDIFGAQQSRRRGPPGEEPTT